MTSSFDVLADFEKAFGALPDEETLAALAGAKLSGMSERAIVVAINSVRNDFEKGNLGDRKPGQAVVKRLRKMWKAGFR